MEVIEQKLLNFFFITPITPYNVALEEVKRLRVLENVAGDEDDAEFLKKAISNINAVTNAYDFEVMMGKSDIDGEQYVTVGATSENIIPKNVKLPKSNQVDLLRVVLHACILSENMCISEIECLNLKFRKTEITKSVAESTLRKLVKAKWLEINDGMVYIGVRSLIELGPLLRQNYPDHIKSCPLCQNIVIYGTKCTNCDAIIHKHCLEKYLQRSQQCPACKKKWNSSGSGTEGKRSIAEPRPSTSGIKRTRRARKVESSSSDSD